MLTKRSSGILLHPSCLPGRYGIGDFGIEAHQFINFLVKAKQRLWQVLPLVPCGLGNSPYMTYGSSAGNILLISPDMLLEDRFLCQGDLDNLPVFSDNKVDFTQVTEWKIPLLQKAYKRFSSEASQVDQIVYCGFCNRNASWLDDFALFSALKDAHQGAAWTNWPHALRRRETEALKDCRETLKDEIGFQKFTQFIFFRQWLKLKSYAYDHGIQVIGDLPIYVAHSSADVWANQEVFQIDPENGKPLFVAGVPPDYFSKTGQLWGNPKHLEESKFNWWVKRMRSTFANFDLVRFDHFRGLEAYWSVPAQEKTAVNGQ
jgi:4-alpha-glucanotransferase